MQPLTLTHQRPRLPYCAHRSAALTSRHHSSSSSSSSGSRRRVSCRSSSGAAGDEAQLRAEEEELSVEIPTVDARSCIKLVVVPTGPAQQAIVVEAVAGGSSAAQAGIQRGMKLTAISDPVRRSEVWELQDRPSIRYIRDVLRMRSSPLIEMRFSQPTAELRTAMEAADDSLKLTGRGGAAGAPSNSSGSSGGYAADSDTADNIASLTSTLSSSEETAGMTMAERMEQQYQQQQQASQGVVAFKQRQQRRADYMAQVGQRKDGNLGLILAASFLLPAVVILGVAYATGYMDSLYTNTMSNVR